MLEPMLNNDEDMAAFCRTCRFLRRWCIVRCIWYQRFKLRFGFSLDPVTVGGNPLWQISVMHAMREDCYPSIHYMWISAKKNILTTWEIAPYITMLLSFDSSPVHPSLRSAVIDFACTNPRDPKTYKCFVAFKEMAASILDELNIKETDLFHTDIGFLPTEQIQTLHPEINFRHLSLELYADIRGKLIQVLYNAYKLGAIPKNVKTAIYI